MIFSYLFENRYTKSFFTAVFSLLYAIQDNEPLMRALSKLICLNNPDLVLFVGEALVGNDAVDQLSKFSQVEFQIHGSSYCCPIIFILSYQLYEKLLSVTENTFPVLAEISRSFNFSQPQIGRRDIAH